ncbi:hypothetical protein Tco_0759273 [Tanacetum coccineum]
MVFNSPCLTDKKDLIQMQTAFGKDLTNPLIAANLLKIVRVFQFTIDSCSKSWTAKVVPKSVAGSRFPAASSTLLPFDVLNSTRLLLFGSKAMKTNLLNTRSFMCSSQDSSRLDVAVKFIFQSSRYVVPTGRVVVPTGRYVVPAGKVIIIVSPGRVK